MLRRSIRSSLACQRRQIGRGPVPVLAIELLNKSRNHQTAEGSRLDVEVVKFSSQQQYNYHVLPSLAASLLSNVENKEESSFHISIRRKNQEHHHDPHRRCPSGRIVKPTTTRTGNTTGHLSLFTSTLTQPFPSHLHHYCYFHHHNNHVLNYAHQTIRTNAFVSRHNTTLQVTANQIIDYCNHHGIQKTNHDYRTTNTHVIMKECPFCSKPTNNKADNLFKLYIKIGDGAYFCHRCGAKGSWYDFKMKLGKIDVLDFHGRRHSGGTPIGGGEGLHSAVATSTRAREETIASSSSSSSSSLSRPTTIMGNSSNYNQFNYMNNNINNDNHNNTTITKCLPMPGKRLSAIYNTELLHGRTTREEGGGGETRENQVLAYLTQERGLTKQTLRKYGVGKAIYRFPSNQTVRKGGGGAAAGAGSANQMLSYYVEAECVTFPWIMRASEIAEQEALRGARYTWDPDVHVDDDGDDDENISTEGTMATAASTSATNDTDNVSDNRADDNVESSTTTQSINKTNIPDHPCGPWTTRRIKARALHNKGWQRLDPPGGGWGLFGWHTVPRDATELVLTEGEYDAMSVYQATKRPAVSLPNGCRSLPLEILPMLEKFDKIYLWMDSDGPGQEGAEQFAKKIGIDRCFVVRPTNISSSSTLSPKDANDALRMGSDLDAIIESAQILPHERIMTFAEMRAQVLHEITHPDKYVGVPLPSLPSFTNIVKGFRRGEMTVLTGPTGSGKTTLLGQMSLDFAEQGINTLWGSFEIQNTRLVLKLMQQFSREPLPLGKPEMGQSLEALADRFESLPLYFMKFHGGSDVDDVLDAMDYAAYVHDVQHIILDNMQFMISRNFLGSAYFDKFDMQDKAIEKFRKFATERNVHVTLVVHPRKEDEGTKLSISSIYGSAKSTQEADTVVILQHEDNRKYLEVKKNRFDGTLGLSPLFFQRKSGRYGEVPELSHDPSKFVKPKKKANTTRQAKVEETGVKKGGGSDASSSPLGKSKPSNRWSEIAEVYKEF